MSQPGAKSGDRVHCPVSGVVFEVGAETPRADVAGRAVYFCCPGCAAYFEKNRARVIALRELSP